ncbi:hypothetical protein KO495_01225 [Colwellia sp. D2M02]|uniref:hypothetical protein n=1 Tax=Colwellia sp. D2M02 TaxID=2841562 RepID=UPI001C08E63C|nr:hypothetical protein [Colwellia sp. D2M02]MBU2891940.1 hypothetical protein [Colwellia sp. D2M02]
MNKLTLVISMITLLWLSSDFWEYKSDDSTTDSDMATQVLHTPSELDNELLAVEEDWLAIQASADLAEAEKLALKNVDVADPNENILTIGDNSYNLLGIFMATDNPFILISLRNKSKVSRKSKLNHNHSNTMKVLLGQEITAGIVLSQLSSDKITLKGAKGTFEFKLFERNSNDTP